MEEIINIILGIVAIVLSGIWSVKFYNRVNDRRSSRNSNIVDRATEYDKRITDLEQRTNRTVDKLQQKISEAQKMDSTNDSE